MTTIKSHRIRITDDYVDDHLLGRFKRTGVVRIPEPGEYYLVDFDGEFYVALHIAQKMTTREYEILEPVKPGE